MLLGRSLALAAKILCVTALASAQNVDSHITEAPRVPDPASKAPETTQPEAAGTKQTEAPRVEGTATKVNEVPRAEVLQAGSATAPTTTSAKDTRGVYRDEKGVRHDPSGKKGISPFWEALRRGDEAALTNDFSVAEEAYQVAIGIEPRNPVAHLRRGQALVRAGRLAQAEAAYQQALHSADKDPTLHAAALFVLADLKERQGLRDEAIAAWALYADDLRKQASAKGYPETPAERDKRLRKYKEIAAESKAVRERIELRVKEVDEANKRKAAKNPNANR